MLNLLQMLELRLNQTLLIPFEPFSFKFLLLAAVFLILLYRWSLCTNSSIPPSPPKLPIIENLHQLSSLPHRSLQTLSQRHGPVMLLHFGSRPVLVIWSAEAASQIFKIHDLIFFDRPKFIFFEKVLYNYEDILSAPYGEYWRQLRSICVLNLLSNKRVRSFGAVRQEETKLMISNILQSCSTISSSNSSSSVLNLSEMFMKLSNDVLCRVAMGRKYSDRGEDSGKQFMELSGDVTEVFTRVNIGDYIPWLAWFTRMSGFEAQLDKLAKRADEFLDMVIQEHMDKSKSANDGMNENEDDDKDFVDVLLAIQKENAVGVPIDGVCIKAIILDMFVAGTDTTFTVLEWTMSELLRNPRVMKKLQDEVRGIVRNRADITEDDLVGMHYMKAVIKETFRLHAPVPLLVPRMSNQDVKLNGYNIKANTQVMVNVWAIGRDLKLYTNPEIYEPERFLNNVIDYKGNDFELIPFGSGRRSCPGMQFAIALKEIALANIVHKFDWALPHGTRAEDLDMNETTGVSAHRKYPLKGVRHTIFWLLLNSYSPSLLRTKNFQYLQFTLDVSDVCSLCVSKLS